jgi:uncharacterized protein (DUF952 family)
MTNHFFQILVTICLFPLLFTTASNEIELSGRLVKKYYKTSVIVQDPAFGWFLELDNTSKASLNNALNGLDANEKQICSNFHTDLVQLILKGGIDPQTCRDLEHQSVNVKGQLWNPPHMYRPIPSHQVSLHEVTRTHQDNLKKTLVEKSPQSFQVSFAASENTWKPCGVNEKWNDIPLELSEVTPQLLVTLKGSLQLKLYPGPPNYESIENGDYPEYCLMLQMDSKSFDIASKTHVLEPALSMTDIMSVSNWSEVQLGLETDMRKFCESHINQEVTLQGYLSHAILAHHHAPFLMSVQSVYEIEDPSTEQNSVKEMTPEYLYKIISVEDWKKSQGMDSVKLSSGDHDFIHLSKEDQLDRIIEKYWTDTPEFIVLKIYTDKLPGKLVYEANPGGSNKYYHLYNGSIPLNAVFESKTVQR